MTTNTNPSDYANLIAAAPLMLEALRAILGALGLRRPDSELITDYGMLGLDAIQRAEAAIARAEGDPQ